MGPTEFAGLLHAAAALARVINDALGKGQVPTSHPEVEPAMKIYQAEALVSADTFRAAAEAELERRKEAT
jgi:hypothetical protein